MSKILIVDDEERIRNVVMEYASLSGYETDYADNGEDALNKIYNDHFDLVILDLMMPKLDGFAVLKKIKERDNTPVIILSARSEEDDKLYTFENGADDYVVKPFSPKELMARAKRLIDANKTNNNKEFVVGKLSIDEKARLIKIDNKPVNMTPKEIDLLLYLVKHKNTAISRDNLIEAVWSYDYNGDDRTIDTHIKMLRKNLGEYADLIVTVRGVGYRFEV